MNAFLNRGALSWLPLCFLSEATCMLLLAHHRSSFVLRTFPETHQTSCFLFSHLVIDLSKQQLVCRGIASTSQFCVTPSSLPTFLSLLFFFFYQHQKWEKVPLVAVGLSCKRKKSGPDDMDKIKYQDSFEQVPWYRYRSRNVEVTTQNIDAARFFDK